MTKKKTQLSKIAQKEIANDIIKTTNALNDLIDVSKSDNMELVDTTLINEMKNRIFIQKEELVLSSLTNDIQHGTVMKKGKPKEYYQVRLPELNKIPRSYSYEGLIERVYTLLFIGDDEQIRKKYTIDKIFKLALEEKAKIKDSKPKTIQRDIDTYNQFITEDFSNKDIRDITYTDLCIFIQERTKAINPTKNGFIAFKCILNLIFRYACNPDHRIIDENPVPSDNSMFRKNVKVQTKTAEDKAFQPNDIILIRQALRERIPKVAYNANVNAYAILF